MYYIISNPSARSGDGKKRTLVMLKKRLRRAGIPYRSLITKGPGDAKRLTEKITAKTARDQVLVVIGGDGTINEVINGIRNFSHLKFAFIPAGSANDLARGLGISCAPSGAVLEHLLDQIVQGKVLRKLDIGNVHLDHRTELFSRQHPAVIPDNQRFLISSGIGFDAGICEEALHSGAKDFLNRIHLGKLTYGAIAYRTLHAVYSHQVSCDGVTMDGRHIHLDHLLFAAAFNTKYEGGGYCFAPDARPDDGKLTFVAIGDLPAARILIHFPDAHWGSHRYYDLPAVQHCYFQKMTIHTAVPLWLHADGEVAMQTDQATWSLLDDRLQMII